LEELEALAMDDEMKKMDLVPMKPIAKKNHQPVFEQAEAEEEEDEDEKMLQDLMAM
jgi:hypothetical protein